MSISETSVRSDDLAKLDATAQADLVRRREISPVELVDAAIERIEMTNPALNAVTHTLYAQARARAAAPAGDGPFAGVPFLFKGLIPVVGAPNTSGCRALKGAIADASPPYVQAFHDAGLIALGLTNTPEFGLIDTTEPLLYGATHNPWDLTRSPAGSSGGAGAAVAAGMVPMAHASDGGGSIRLPANNNGVFGLKPSRGRNRFAGVPPLPYGLPEITTDHVVSRSVRDSARMLSLTEEPASALGPVGFVQAPTTRRLRIALVREGTGGGLASPEVDAAVLATAKLCEDLGHTVEPAAWPFVGTELIDAFFDEWQLLSSFVVAMACSSAGCAADLENFEPWTLELARRGAALTPERIEASRRTMEAATGAMEQMLTTHDVLLSPVLRHLPKPLGDHAPNVPLETLWDRVVDNVAYTPIFNVTGMPAMSVPLNWSAQGLPIGSQFAAPIGGEGLLLALAYQLEAARPWADKWAPNSFPVIADHE